MEPKSEPLTSALIGTTSEAAAVAEIVQNLFGAQISSITHGEVTAPVAILPKGQRIESLKPLLSEFLPRPVRRKGTASVFTEASLVGLVNRFKDDNSVLYADLGNINDLRESSPSITAIFDYHEAGGMEDGKPRFGEHRAQYEPPLSREFLTWLEKSNKAMNQRDFAEFIEDNISDLFAYEPQQFGDSKLAEYAKLVGGTFATPSRLMELSKGLSVHSESKVVNKLNLSTGETQLVFEENHEKSAQVVPNMFLIAVPVFEAGPAFTMIARLRYRISNGTVNWTYILHQPEKVLKHAFDETCARIQAAVELPLFCGLPE